METGQIAELRRWAQQLHEGSGAENRAAGRAILMLLDEIERLREELERSRSSPPDDPPAEPEDEEPPPKQSWFRRNFGIGELRQKLDLRSLPRRRLAKWALGLALLATLVFASLALGAVLTAPALDGRAKPAMVMLPVGCFLFADCLTCGA